MKVVTLQRMESSDHGTFGRLVVDGLSFFTGELPWRENASNISCIPAGKYNASFTMSPRFKRKMYLLTPVDSRSGIRMHSANRMGDESRGYISELSGCISLCEKIGWIGKQKALLLSAPAMRKFEKHMEQKPFILEVIDV